MQALILAAGNSRRLLPQTVNFPKTLLKLENQEILGHIFNTCIACGIFKFNIVTGHGEKYVKDYVNKYKKKFSTQIAKGDLRSNDIHKTNLNLHFERSEAKSRSLIFDFIYNDKFAKWGNIYSMYVARDMFNEDFILINSDVIFKKEILKKLLNSPHKNAMAIDDYKKLGQEEMKVYINKKSRILKIHKSLNPKKSDGEYIGILKISAEIKEYLVRALRDKLKEDKKVYYEDALQVLIDRDILMHKVSTRGLPCMEIDTPEDLEKAKKLIKKCM